MIDFIKSWLNGKKALAHNGDDSWSSESAFSWECRIIHDSRSSLTSDVVETLLCLKDWLLPLCEI